MNIHAMSILGGPHSSNLILSRSTRNVVDPEQPKITNWGGLQGLQNHISCHKRKDHRLLWLLDRRRDSPMNTCCVLEQVTPASIKHLDEFDSFLASAAWLAIDSANHTIHNHYHSSMLEFATFNSCLNNKLGT
eukprot:5329068-Amphidinium_carterae.1